MQMNREGVLMQSIHSIARVCFVVAGMAVLGGAPALAGDVPGLEQTAAYKMEQAHELKAAGKTKEALQIYEAVISGHAYFDDLGARARLAAAEIHADAGDKDRAQELAQEVVKYFQISWAVEHAERLIASFGAVGEEKPPEENENVHRQGAGPASCQSCHVKGGEESGILSAPLLEVCAQCHPWRGDEVEHPVGVPLTPEMGVTQLPLADGLVDCQTCHDVHLETKFMLRMSDESPYLPLCLDCHDKPQEGAPRRPGQGTHPKDAECNGVCHLPADDPRFPADGKVWRSCLQCHEAKHKDFEHPLEVPLSAGMQTALPLTQSGNMFCQTCHLTHGVEEMMLQLPAASGELCVECHLAKWKSKDEAAQARLSLDLRNADLAEVAMRFAEAGVSLSYDGALAGRRVTFSGRGVKATEVLEWMAGELGARVDPAGGGFRLTAVPRETPPL